jgi:hypothetical protein
MKVLNEKRINYRDHLGRFRKALDHETKVEMINNEKLLREERRKVSHGVYKPPVIKKQVVMFTEGFWLGVLSALAAITVGLVISF